MAYLGSKLATVVSFVMAEPTRLMGHAASNPGPDDVDADGEYEIDEVNYGQPTPSQRALDADGHTSDAEGSDVDAEGEDVDEDADEDEDEDEAEPVGAVKIAQRRSHPSEEEAEYEDEDAAGEVLSDAHSHDTDNDDSSSAGSDEENQWQADDDDGGEEESVAKANSNACTYCNQDENDDPSPEFEEYLSCVVCGDNAHQQCARDNHTLRADDDAKEWRCTACIQHHLHVNGDGEDESQKPYPRRRLSSTNKLTKELLPSHRGVDPGGHSIFKELLLPDEPTDGPRSLRKRKNSHEEEFMPPRPTRKKRRSSELSLLEAQPSVAASSPRPPSRSARAVSGNESENHDADPSGSEQEDGTRLRSSRARRAQPRKTDRRPLAWIEESQGLSLIIAFHLNNEQVQKIVTAKPKKKTLTLEQERQERRRERDRERRERNRRAAQAVQESPEVAHYPSLPAQQTSSFLSLVDRETDEAKSKPYGGVLSEADADTSKTYPLQSDRRRFEDARIKADEAWAEKQAALYPPEPARPSKQAATASKIKCINFGGWEIDTWHAAPYPEEYSKNRVLYICEFCLKYMNSDYVAWRHKLKCPAKHPPGDEIYRDGKYSFFEVDGRKNPVYCQNLCLLAKLFLGSKTLYYDVEPFLFYIMTENDEYGCHFVGYFSKEKRPSSLNNVSCIHVLPIHMRKGYGQYLIEFSYLLTRVERKTGSPEKPLSDMGLVSYRKYWRLVLCEQLLDLQGATSISAISDRTGMTPDDIVSALEGMRALVRDPVTKSYAFRLDLPYIRQYVEKCNAAGKLKIDPTCLVWTPYIMGRLGQYEDGPALQTVQQRDEIDDQEQPPLTQPPPSTITKLALNGFSTSIAELTASEPEPASQNGDSPVPSDTPFPNASSTIALAGSHMGTTPSPIIPPTRYEIFPPLPGQPAAKRRPGRPFGTRRRTSTPNRARNGGMGAGMHTAPVPRMRMTPFRGAGANSRSKATPATVSVRRTRSRLGESVLLGDEGASNGVTNGGTDAAVRTPSFSRGRAGTQRSTRSSASSMGSPSMGGGTHRRSNASEQHAESLGVPDLSTHHYAKNGTQRYQQGEGDDGEDEEDEGDEQDDEDMDAAYDEIDDDDDGMDVDAEGEDDDDVVMGGVVA